MGLSGVEIDLIMRLKDKVSGKLGKMRSKFAGFGKAVAKSLAIGAAGAVLLGVAVGGALLKIGGDFNKAFSTIRAGTGATDEAMIGLKQTFKDTLATVPDDMATVASAIADVNTELGFTDERLESATKAALTAGRVFDADVATIIKKGADALSVFNREGEDFEIILDKVAVVSQATGVPIDALLGKVQTFGPVLRNAGFSFEETVALFGSLEASGIDLTRVMPALNANFRRLAKGGVTDLKGAFEGQIKQIKNAKTQTEALALASEIFGAEGAQRMLVAIQDGTLNLDELTIAMENSEGTIERLGEANLTLGDRFAIMKNKGLVAIEPIAARVFGLIEDAFMFIEAHAPAVQAKFQSIFEKVRPHLVAVIDRVKAFATGALPAMVAVFTDKVIPAFETFRAELTAVVERFLPPVAAFVTDVLLPAFRDLTDWAESKLPAMRDALEQVGIIAAGAWEAFQVGIETLMPVVRHIAEVITGTVIPPIKLLFNFIIDNKPLLVAAMVAIGAAIVLALGPVSLAMLAIIGLIAAIGWLRDNWRIAGNAIIGFVEKMINGIIQGFAFAADKIGDFIEAVLNPFISSIAGIAGLVGIDLPSNIQLGSFGVGGVAVSLPRIAGPVLHRGTGNDPVADQIVVEQLIVEGSVIREAELAQVTVDTIIDAADEGILTLS